MSLDLLRRSQSWLTRGVLILLAITFIFGFGFSITRLGSIKSVPQGTAAEVNGEKIPLPEFYKARDIFYRQIRQQHGEIPERTFNFIGIAALNQLIDLKLMAQKAKQLGFRITDEELSETIRSNPAFQVDGKFIGAEAYKSYVEQALNETVGEFESKYREELLAQKLVNFINTTAKVTDEELLNLYKMQNEKVNVYFVSFSPENFMSSFSPTEEEIKDYYEEHKREFKTQELRSIRYITLSPEDLTKRVSLSEEEIKAYYDAYPNEFKSEKNEVRPFSEVRNEIEVKIHKQREESVRTEFLKKLEEQIQKESLSKIAEENGLEKVKESKPFSATANSADTPPQIIQRAFSIGEGEMTFSQVEDNIWVIELTKIVPSHLEELEEAKEEVIQELKSVKAKEAAQSKAEEVLNKAKTSGEGLEKIAKSLGLKLEETGYFARTGNIAEISTDDLQIDAFSLADKNPLASKVYSAHDKFYVISLKEKQGINPKEFEEKKTELKESELSKRRRELYLDWIQKLRQESKIVVNENLFTPQG
ncbi:MAG: peptidylprolyl isomerase [Deltaproteobacteria bacterium]|nr:peptidylprolyl isomerase [Deltaproteobacteria bacterium]